jgi:hypothetical protein
MLMRCPENQHELYSFRRRKSKELSTTTCPAELTEINRAAARHRPKRLDCQNTIE